MIVYILWWVAQPLFWLPDNIHDFVVTVRGNHPADGSDQTCVLQAVCDVTGQRRTCAVAPEMAEIKERYGDNREKLGQEMMKLYKTEKINPLSGCLLILAQMPVFIARIGC